MAIVLKTISGQTDRGSNPLPSSIIVLLIRATVCYTTTMQDMAGYMRNRYHERRKEAFEILDGRCSKCESTQNLEIDHKDRNKKVFDGTRMTSVSREKFLAEIAKCQLLCRKCHDVKTIVELGKKVAKGTHGTLSSYRYCKCYLCRKVKSEYMRAYNSKGRVATS